MLSALLESSTQNLPDIWGEGALLAFSGMDGATQSASDFVGSLGSEMGTILFHTPKRRVFRLKLTSPVRPRIVTGDVLGLETARGDCLLTYAAWHSLVGHLPVGSTVDLEMESGQPARPNDSAGGSTERWITEDAQAPDSLVLMQSGRRIALSYGRTVEQALRRAERSLTRNIHRTADSRLCAYSLLPALRDPERDRLLKKCLSVMRVNTLGREGAIGQHWSTPDRVPHRAMWLWDSVFHSLGMNRVDPNLAWELLKSVLDTQRADGMIPHRADVDGAISNITQPPLLAWGVWENYRALGGPETRDTLEYALPRLERYLAWIVRERRLSGNSLLAWHIEGDALSRSGESGMDNSPRFDAGTSIAAVDLNTYVAQDMLYLGRIADETGRVSKGQMWRLLSHRTSRTIHERLWSSADGFYLDRSRDGTFSNTRAVTGFLPLLLDDVPPDRVSRLVGALNDPRNFSTAFPLPSVAISHPEWSTDMWRGPTWINMNYMVAAALRKRGLYDESTRLAQATIHHVSEYYDRYGVLFEFYDAKDEIPPAECARKGPRRGAYDIRVKMDSIRDYHWTAALTLCLLLQDRGAWLVKEGAL